MFFWIRIVRLPSFDSFCKSFIQENLKYNKVDNPSNPWGNNALLYGQHRKEYQNPVINKNAEIDTPKGQRDDSKIKKGWDVDFSQLKYLTYFHSFKLRIIIASRSHSILFAFL